MVTLVASRWESSGYTVLETMLQGCPLVCTDAGACPESVVDRITGRLAKSEDPLDFADKLCAVLNEPDSAAAMGRAARRFVLEQHSAATIAAASVKLYESLIGKHTDA
jgi:glycosyltransferase involved in cell wall biosynthesis